MHLLVILAIAGLLLYLYFHFASHRQAEMDRQPVATADGGDDAFTGRRLAFISRGKLFYSDDAGAFRELHSPYVQGVIDRLERARQRRGWKEGTAFETSFVSNQTNLPSEQVDIRATTALFTPQGNLLYFLRDESVGGLFEFDFASGDEKRLIHQQKLLLDDLALDEDGTRLVCAQHASNGTSNIGLLNADGSDYRELTGGDTVDSAPAWLPAEQNRIVFQSSGVARNDAGFVIAQGPASLQLLDLQQGDLSTVKEDKRYDFLQPKVGPSGDLHFIRRPYEPPRYRAGSFVVDFLLFPFRLLRALFHYLNFFSLMYTRKPLTSASGPEVKADLKEMLVKGKRIDAENALRKERRVNGVPSLVPGSWQLVRRKRDGNEQVLASNVAAYDITADGQLVYTNGFGVFVLDVDNHSRLVLRDKLIADLVVH